jgi:hypothetical protein
MIGLSRALVRGRISAKEEANLDRGRGRDRPMEGSGVGRTMIAAGMATILAIAVIRGMTAIIGRTMGATAQRMNEIASADDPGRCTSREHGLAHRVVSFVAHGRQMFDV